MVYPPFSIIIPTYQRRDFVRETVQSLGQLQYSGELEIIVVADGCTDGTAAAVTALHCPFPLRVIDQHNSGAGAARNRGAAAATGEILLFLDDDMMVEPDIVEEHARSFRDGADAVIGDFTEPGSGGAILSQILEKRRAAGHSENLNAFDIFGGHISMRRAVFEKIGGFDETFAGNGDYGDFDIGRRLLSDFVIVHNPKALSHHRGILGPRAHARRAQTCARATLKFANKHPELTSELVKWTGANRISRRLRRISRIPLLPRLLSTLAAIAAEWGTHTPLRSSEAVRYLRNVAYTLAYWSTIQRNGGLGR